MANKIKVTRFNAVGEPNSKTGKRALVIVGLVLILFVGFFLGRTFASRQKNTYVTPPKQTTIAETHTTYGPNDTKGIVPAKFDHSTNGAVAAASSYIGYTPRYYLMSDGTFQKAMKKLSSDEYYNTLFTGMTQNRVLSRATIANDPNAFFREIPLGYVVSNATEDQVTVNVWSETMLVAQPDFNGNTSSKLHTMTLVWEHGDWKIDSWTNQPGPTPRWQSEEEPMTVSDFITAIEPFTGGYDYAPSF